ncbi:hypothetical protein [Austwickia chelonae]|uniref:hypothetical protein n=1 Tax=Austwickia chelonae TaxID=100225 RepID=UPI00196761A9|nr:hypothetical protein [Austwickia chelonae]
MPAPERVLVVDVANVMGSVPDGWWKNRVAAAGRLHAAVVDALDRGLLPYDRAILVMEGQSRAGAAEGVMGTTYVVHAPGSGDDEIVLHCRALAEAEPAAEITVATADRGLIARVAAMGADIVGPRSIPRDTRRQATPRR